MGVVGFLMCIQIRVLGRLAILKHEFSMQITDIA